MMPTSIQMICKARTGFSIMELMVVMVIFATLIAIGLPRFDSFFEQPYKKEFRHLVRTLNLLRNEAILGNSIYYLVFDTKKQIFHVEKQLKEGDRAELDAPKMLKPHPYPEDFPLQQATLTDNPRAAISSEILKLPVEIRIDSSGFVTPFSLIFYALEEQQYWLMKTKNIMGDLVVEPAKADILHDRS